MDKIKIEDLPEVLDNRYLTLISTDSIDVKSLNEILNTNNVITGLVDEYYLVNKNDGFEVLLIKVDDDSIIHSDKLNAKVSDNLYICDTSHYSDIVSKTINSMTKGEATSGFDMSDLSYGYNDLKVMIRRVDDEHVRVLLLIPFTGSPEAIALSASTFQGMCKVAYGIDIEKEDIDEPLSSIAIKFLVPLKPLEKHGRRNFDAIINHLLSVINLDKYTSMEYLSSSDNIISLLN